MTRSAALTLAGSSEIAAVATLARAAGRSGIDTECTSEGRYRALLCLVQVVVEDPSAPDGVRIILIDALRDDVDVGPLAALVGEPDVQVVLHAGRQDVAILRRVWDTEVNNIFDTQVAAGF